MRRSGSPILEKYRRTKRRKMLVQAKKPGRGRQPMILLCPGSWASSVGGTDNKKGQEEPGPPESVLMSNPSFHVCGNEGPVGKPRPWVTGVWGWAAWGLGSPTPSPELPAPWGPNGRQEWASPGVSPCAPGCLAVSLLHFLKTSFSLLFGAADLELSSPELSGFYFKNCVRHDDINQVVFSLIMTKEFLLFFPPLSSPRELMTLVPRTRRSQGGWPPG